MQISPTISLVLLNSLRRNNPRLLNHAILIANAFSRENWPQTKIGHIVLRVKALRHGSDRSQSHPFVPCGDSAAAAVATAASKSRASRTSSVHLIWHLLSQSSRASPPSFFTSLLPEKVAEKNPRPVSQRSRLSRRISGFMLDAASPP